MDNTPQPETPPAAVLSCEVPEAQALGHRLRELRIAAGYSQQAAASDPTVGVSISTVQRAEHSGATSLHTLRALVRLYGTTLADLFAVEADGEATAPATTPTTFTAAPTRRT